MPPPSFAPPKPPQFCQHLLNQPLYQNVNIADAVASLLQLVGIGIVLIYMWYIKRQARGQRDSSSSLVQPFLPIYELYVRAIFFLSCFWAFFGILPQTSYLFETTYSGHHINLGNATSPPYERWMSTRISRSIFVGINWGSFHTLFWFVLALLCHPGMGTRTIRLSTKIALGVGLWTGSTICFGTFFGVGSIISQILMGCWTLSMTLLYMVVWLVPQRRLAFYRRPAARTYAAFWSVLRLGGVLSTLLDYMGYDDLALCGHWIFAWLLFGLFWPVAMVLTFRRDTEFWRGGFRDPDPGPCACWGCRQCYSSRYQSHAIIGDKNFQPRIRSQSSLPENDVRRPLFDLGNVSQRESTAVRIGMDSISHAMLIPYCNLHMDAMRILGSGGTSNVYRGELVLPGASSTCPVAIKMLTCFELTPDVVDSFFQEASVLYEHSNHPHIVRCYGITVAPPTMCIVLECCDGDLTELLSKRGSKRERDEERSSSRVTTNELTQFLSEAIQCATAVAYLHSQSPPILHRDIKSSNFLLSSSGKLKLGDLGLAKMTEMTTETKTMTTTTTEAADSSISSPRGEYTLAWAAPELIAGGHATKCSDVYALILVLWEVLHPGELPFDDPADSYWKMEQKIQEGERPSLEGLEAMVARSISEKDYNRLMLHNTTSKLRTMFEECWDHDPVKRWSAENIVEVLSDLLLQLHEN